VVVARGRVLPPGHWYLRQAGGVTVFKRRKPEPPPAAPSRGHVIASGPQVALAPRTEGRGDADSRGVAPPNAPALEIGIPAMPDPTPPPPTPPQPKEPMLMSRPPLQPTPPSPTMPHGTPQGAAQGLPTGLSRAPMAPVRMPPQAGERRTLVVGRGISVKGT